MAHAIKVKVIYISFRGKIAFLKYCLCEVGEDGDYFLLSGLKIGRSCRVENTLYSFSGKITAP